ncbi:Hypothetical protein R9X50_00576900 [Acrodontium crateriforme]|uniref:Uncharacterized protein n=1 Tax=Acrodontium crateriforme TaxID=150365 RepID=A0AAQ3R688_9PEZI|nr:Hypothetical protein R9X50_00576900 [Acrodontium crateriforme]
MSSEQSFPTSDLRTAAQDYKRAAEHKYKWRLGAVETVTRTSSGSVRPHRPSETCFNYKRREIKGAVAALQSGVKVARKQDMLDGAAASDDSTSSGSDLEDVISPPVDAGVMYSFDASRAPTHGSQVLTTALDKAVQRYEERETVKLVKNEYDMLDADGETVLPSPMKKEKGKSMSAVAARVPDADEDYEFV